jgi:integrase/recombinase XerD
VLERYQRFLFYHRKKNGQPLSFRTQHACLVPLRVWFRWVARQNYILHNPAADLELPLIGYRLPKHVLTATETEQVLAQPDISDPLARATAPCSKLSIPLACGGWKSSI